MKHLRIGRKGCQNVSVLIHSIDEIEAHLLSIAGRTIVKIVNGEIVTVS